MASKIELPAKITRASVQVLINKMRSSREYSQPQEIHSSHCPRFVPGNNDLHYRMAIEAQGPLMTYNEDGQFSAPDLTAWYAQQFVKENHLVA